MVLVKTRHEKHLAANRQLTTLQVLYAPSRLSTSRVCDRLLSLLLPEFAVARFEVRQQRTRIRRASLRAPEVRSQGTLCRCKRFTKTTRWCFQRRAKPSLTLSSTWFPRQRYDAHGPKRVGREIDWIIRDLQTVWTSVSGSRPVRVRLRPLFTSPLVSRPHYD